jgi:predicted nucleic acid-binding protein
VQNVAEFWNVSTRPVDKNRYGLSAQRTNKSLALIEKVCDVVTEDRDSFHLWKELLIAHSITGVAVHDARLVSVMLAHGISAIVTFNTRDFQRYAGIVVRAPSEV